MNKSLVTYSLLFLILVPFFGFNFLVSLVSNVLLLILLVPLLILLITFLGLYSLKSKVKTCNQCGSISLGTSNTCVNCGANLSDTNSQNLEDLKIPGETTIEVKAEEVD